MSLTYTTEKVTRTTETVQLHIPSEWGMFTPAGNKSLATKAKRLVEEVQTKTSFSERSKAFEKFFRAWRRMGRTKTMGEASDTAVREVVWCFAVKVGKCIDISESTINDIWESDAAYPSSK